MTEAAKKHGLGTRLFHWGFVALIIFAYIRNGDVNGALDSPDVMRKEIFFGIFVGLLLAARYFWVRKAGATRLPASAPAWERRASKIVHLGMYLGLALVILSGFGIALVVEQGGVLLEAVADTHIILTDITLLLMVVHVAAAIWHKIHRKDGVMESMTGKLPI